MGNPVLARYSIRSKQEYIFKTNRLVEIDGASKIIAGAFVVLFECVGNCKYRRVPKQAKKEGMTAPNVVYW